MANNIENPIIETQLKKGVLGLCVLALLSQGDSYSYEIASKLADAVDMGEGTIYPLMRRMQADGLVATYLVESSSGPPRKYYRLTDQGRESLEQQAREWTSFTKAVDRILATINTSNSTSNHNPTSTSNSNSNKNN